MFFIEVQESIRTKANCQGQSYSRIKYKCLDFYPKAGSWLLSECFFVLKEKT